MTGRQSPLLLLHLTRAGLESATVSILVKRPNHALRRLPLGVSSFVLKKATFQKEGSPENICILRKG